MSTEYLPRSKKPFSLMRDVIPWQRTLSLPHWDLTERKQILRAQKWVGLYMKVWGGLPVPYKFVQKWLLEKKLLDCFMIFLTCRWGNATLKVFLYLHVATRCLQSFSDGRAAEGGSFKCGGRTKKQLLPTWTRTDFAVPLWVHCVELWAAATGWQPIRLEGSGKADL